MKVKCIDISDLVNLVDFSIVLGGTYEVECIIEEYYKINGYYYFKHRFEIIEEETQMTNKEQIMRDLVQLQKTIADAYKQADELREQLNKPEYKALFDLSNQNKSYVWASRFVYPDQDTAKAYHEAFGTLIQLRKCHGSEPVSDKEQHFISLNHSNNLRILRSRFVGDKVSEISPAFDTQENAQKAIESIGEENIINMFKTFHGVK